MVALRSAVFNAVFYLFTAATLIVCTPFYFFLPQAGSMAVVRAWAVASLWLLKVICGTGHEFRGLDNLSGTAIIASKHQSLWETFALLKVVPNPACVVKRELLYVPIWGWWAWKAGRSYVDRGGGTAALKRIAEGARRELARGRPVLIFPEGTRLPPGAAPAYKHGIAHLYIQLKAPVVPVALNSGLFWPRRRFLRHPGTIVVEFLPPIEPGLSPRTFLHRLEERIEAACERLLVEADRQLPRPPFPPEAEARLASLRAGIASPTSGLPRA